MKNKLISLCLCLVLLLSVSPLFCFAAEDAAAPALKFDEDGKFTILHLTDTQDDQYPAHELKPFLERAIEQAKPDLIVFTGDLVEDFRLADFTDYFGIMEGVLAFGLTGKDKEKTRNNSFMAANYVLSIFEESGVPFAMTQGNNDYKVYVSNEDWKAFYANYKNNLTNDMSTASEGIDYRLSIYGSDGKDVKLNLYCLDSGKHGISTESVDWYAADSDAQKAENGKTVPAFVFQHIPVDELGRLFTVCDKSDPNGVLVASLDGIKHYKLVDTAHGYFENVYYGDAGESYEFTTWKQKGDVVAAFFGHMHQDGYSGTCDGIELNMTYGCEFAKSGPYGMRVITLDETDVTNYENQLYSYNDGTFTPDPFNMPPKSFGEKAKLFVDSLRYIAKTMIRKVLPV